VEVFGNQRLPEVADVVRARLAALFQPAVTAGERVAGPPGDRPDTAEGVPAGHLRSGREVPTQRTLTRRHLAVVAAVTLVAVVASGAWLLRAKAVPLAVAATVASSSPSPSLAASERPSSTPTPSASRRPTILVHVLGAVVSPGLVTLSQGARVADALAAAGGLRPDADPAELNLAGILSDGCQIVVGTRASPRGEVRDGAGTSGSSGMSAVTAPVDLNSATLSQLDGLPGVGPVTAQAILDYRDKHRRFNTVEELQEVDGIGAKTYAQIAPHVRV
jgi:competence protein ComEA